MNNFFKGLQKINKYFFGLLYFGILLLFFSYDGKETIWYSHGMPELMLYSFEEVTLYFSTAIILVGLLFHWILGSFITESKDNIQENSKLKNIETSFNEINLRLDKLQTEISEIKKKTHQKLQD
tara:strand:- start:152 stop:523 length:372 start_codon:yes stop_codon:yes gene_type:complete